MWPWEHAAVAYLAYSAVVHALRRRSPTGPEAIAIAVGSVFPDLIDKPLAWEFEVFGAGYGVAHSVFFAVPMAVGVAALARRRERAAVGAAFAVGYLLHLPADLFVGYVTEGRVPFARVLWPLRSVETSYDGGFSGTLVDYLGGYLGSILSGDVGTPVAVGLGALGLCVLVWLIDGAPGVRGALVAVRDIVAGR
ncbi:metal-dependent hydrolase [Halobellus sp. GM3]|uniref:metal-dependent hydrolase n=1 Tax=Halobellus sp. GM3 TaxID=3458410 RepID=UPI00403D6707